jgi:murein DD-endopeptidase MepM/ murein hydrolase activator NlpD
LKEAISQETVSDSSHSCIPEENGCNSPSSSLKSAAMLGFALSVGASGALVSQAEASAAVPAPTPSAATEAFSSNSKVSVVAAEAAAVQSPAAQSQIVAFHTVESGESLWQIAQQYRVGLRELKDANALPPETAIRVGQVLKVPSSTQATTATPQILASITADESSIQASQASSQNAPQAIRQQNNLDQQASNQLSAERSSAERSSEEGTVVAQSVAQSTESEIAATPSIQIADASVQTRVAAEAAPVITALATPSTASSVAREYQVRAGDTLSKIASSLGTTSEALIRANALTNPNVILVGDVLRVPSSSQATSQATSQASALEKPGATLIASSAPASESERLGYLRSTAARPEAAQILEDLRGTTPEALVSVGGEQPTAKDLLTPAAGDSIDPYVANLLAEVREIRGQSAQASEASIAGANTADNGVIANGVIESDVSETRSPLLARNTLRNTPRSTSGSEPRTASRPERVTPRSNNLSERVALSTSQPSADDIDSELLAAAPLSPDAYIPAQRSSEPQVVSPDMPLLPEADEYLPEAPNQFDGYIWPARGTLSSVYGWRWGRMHQGIDVAGPVGTPIVAAAPGVVEQAGWNDGGFGNLVEIRHSDGSMTRYAHNNRLNVSTGQTVAQGQQIAEMGSTGYSTGPHLHFEVHPEGSGAVNPVAYLPSEPPS